jgi:hypothetical protein
MDSWDNPAYEAALAYQKTAALAAAVKLNVIPLMGGGAATSDALAEKTTTSSRGMRILCVAEECPSRLNLSAPRNASSA